MTTCLKGDIAQVTNIEAWSEVERELQVRARIYDNWVRDSKMSWADGRDRYARLKRASMLLKAIAEDEALNETPFTPKIAQAS